MELKWTEPKTNWSAEDRFNIADFNRIKNNILWLHQKAIMLYKNFNIEDMGEDVTTFKSYWNVAFFNAFETNIEAINKSIYTQDFGISQKFFENGPFIKFDELNRIENSCLSMKEVLERQESGLKRLPIRLGNMKGIKS